MSRPRPSLAPLDPHSAATSGDDAALREAHANTRALIELLPALNQAGGANEAIKAMLDIARAAFDYDYASFFSVGATSDLCLIAESGMLSPEFRRQSAEAHYPRGQGPLWDAWQGAGRSSSRTCLW